MDGAFPSEKGVDYEGGDDFRGQRKGFRGTSENAKTKICMRCVWIQLQAQLV